MHSQALYDVIISKFIGISLLFLLGYGLNYFLKSERFGKFLSVKTYLLFIFIIVGVPIIVTLLNKKDQLWTEKNIKELKRILVTKISNEDMPFSEEQKNELADCIIQKYKLEVPDAKKEDMNTLFDKAKIAHKECAEEIVANQKLSGWTKKFEEMLFDKFFNEKQLVAIMPDAVQRGNVAGCMLNQLKNAYPNGIDMRELESRGEQIYSPCFK